MCLNPVQRDYLEQLIQVPPSAIPAHKLYRGSVSLKTLKAWAGNYKGVLEIHIHESTVICSLSSFPLKQRHKEQVL